MLLVKFQHRFVGVVTRLKFVIILKQLKHNTSVLAVNTSLISNISVAYISIAVV